MVDRSYFRSPSAICKMVEITLLVIVMSTFFSEAGCRIFPAAKMRSGAALFISSTIVPCFLNAILLPATHIMGYTQLQETPLELMLYSYYTLATFSSSIVLMAARNSTFIASGVFCLFLSLVYVAEVYFAYMRLTSRPVSFPPTFQEPNPAEYPTNTGPPTYPTNTAPPTYPTNTGPPTYPPIHSSYTNPSPSSFEPTPAQSVFSPPPYYPPDTNTGPPTTTTTTTATAAAAAAAEVAVDTVDKSQTDHNKSIYNTNPTYPEALNYPPKDIQPYF
ncbi:hypothetical protein Pcinc_040558 [Petrolisthes cinctipes]|uniref:MARVEL domain-containing protein n=1 Tax=Petrolisthes cinctipes TaxID=88211 RepID=A0AAE1BM07_PETCI|nr:hypothetical protein Pcinc_040558 [Petrolisthes cinctipes]